MSKNHGTTGRIDHKPTDAPTTDEIAALLDADADLLAAFVENHHDPTAPIVLGWASRDAQLPEPPVEVVDAVEAWLSDRIHRDPPEGVDVPDDGRLRWNRDDNIANEVGE